MVANQAQVFGQIMDYYLSDEGKTHLPEINRLAKLDTPEADDVLLHYLMEAISRSILIGEVACVHSNRNRAQWDFWCLSYCCQRYRCQ